MLKIEIEGEKYRIKFVHRPQSEMIGDVILLNAGTECYIFNEFGHFIEKGRTYLSPKDNYDRNYGRKLSLMRALQCWLPKEKRKPIWDAYFASRHGKY